MSFIYQFSIRKTATSEPAVEVHPIWKDDLSIEMAKESQQQFFRRKLSGSIDLIRDDYDLIMNEPFGTVFFLEIWTSVDGGSTYSFYWRGRFTLTDCKVNTDDKILTVKPEVYDEYTDILAGLEREFDLIKLTPVIDKIRLSKRPCLQIYVEDEEKISCLCGNISWEQDVSIPSTDDVEGYLVDNCHFALIDTFSELNFTTIPSGETARFATPFTGFVIPDSFFTNSVNYYHIRYWERYVSLPDYRREYFNGLDVLKVGDPVTEGNVKWRFQQWYEGSIADDYLPLPATIEFTNMSTNVIDLIADLTSQTVYSRMVCNVDTFEGNDTYDIPSDDLITYNRNYKKCYPYEVALIQTDRSSANPTEWGRMEDGNYFLPPNSIDTFLPIGRSRWMNTSLWYQLSAAWLLKEQEATQQFFLNDAYPLWSCISVLLNEIAPDITFEGTTDYSDFLYSGHDEIAVRDNCLYLTPKSNITNGEYQTPAQKAPVTLKDILSMLKNVYQCYWFVERKMVGGLMKTCLRIEHIRYFLYGGSYSSLHPSVGTDLTTMINRRNGKAWSFAVNSYEFDKIDMPERYQFAWMDEVTDPFKGKPIVVLSSYVEQGKVEEINVANFTSDIDFMMLNPSSISPDGFALLNVLTDQNDGTLYVPVITFTQVGYSWRSQNGYLSFHMLQFGYWKDNMPAWRLQFEDDPNITAETIQRNKKQTVTIPLTITDPDPMQLVKTGLGNGQVQSMSIRLTSRIAKTILKYDTE